MSASSYTARQIFSCLLRGETFTPPQNIYVSLHTAVPDMRGGNEVTTGMWPAYSRLDAAQGKGITNGFTIAALEYKRCTNLQDLLWKAYDGENTIMITHFALFDAVTGGNCLWTGSLTVAKTLNPTDECVIHVGQMTLAIA